MKVTLDGKVVLITGAARGIGAAIATRAGQAGATLFLTDRDPLESTPANGTHQADLADPAAPAAIIEAALARFGRIDALVNAAGLTHRAGLQDAEVGLWNTMFSVNTRAPFFLMRGVIADMTARGAAGAIVNILSMNAHVGAPDLAVYSGTKGALATLTKNAANAHLADHVRVNGINLGWVATETERHLHAHILGKGAEWIDKAAAAKPLGRLVSEDDCARLALFLLSDVSAPLTGACIDLEQDIVGAPR